MKHSITDFSFHVQKLRRSEVEDWHEVSPLVKAQAPALRGASFPESCAQPLWSRSQTPFFWFLIKPIIIYLEFYHRRAMSLSFASQSSFGPWDIIGAGNHKN